MLSPVEGVTPYDVVGTPASANVNEVGLTTLNVIVFE